ncbi:MAG TPA: TolC family protein [Bryobacteraceae bacterium]|nr:TolC family protein [Bryobacteraceae bacterium]
MRIFRFAAVLAAALPVCAYAETYTLTMKQAVDRGLSNNPDVTLAKLDELKAVQGIKVAQAPFYPQVGAGTGLAYTNGFPLSIDGSAPSIVQAKATEFLFNQPQRYAVKQQRESAKTAGFATAQKRDEIAYQIASLYVDADRANRLIDTARGQISSFEKVLSTIQARIQEGRELPIEGTQAQVNLTRAKVRLSDLEADRDTAERKLAIALGYGASDLVAPSPEERTETAQAQDEAAAVQAALTASPEIRRIQSELVAKGLEVKSTEARRLPQIDLVAQYALFAKYNDLDQYFARFQRNNGELGVSIQFPLFAGVGIKANLATLDTDRKHLEVELESAKTKIQMAVHQAYQGIDRSMLANDLAKQDLDLARQRLTLVLDQLNDGRATLRETEQARIDEGEKWIAFYDAQFNLERARLELLHQTGALVASLQ